MNQTIFRINGNDRLSFLQGQLTNDVNSLSTDRALFAGYCDPKGRLLTTLLLVIHGEDWLMLLPSDNADSVIKRLQMFVMRADVQFVLAKDLSSSIASIAGNDNDIWSCTAPDNDSIVALPGKLALIISNSGSDTDTSEQQLVAAGIPEVSAATSGELLPQSINLDLIGGVSFNKGCYTGQEIVARLHFRGTPARRLYRLNKPVGTTLSRGDKIIDHTGTAVGMVVRDAAGSECLLASLKTKATDSTLSSESDIQLSQPLALAD